MKKDKDKDLGDRISWLRADRGLKQTEVAHDIGVAIGTYQLFEYGNHPSRKNIERIIDFYQCSRSWLLTGEGVPYPERPEERPETSFTGIRQPTVPYGPAVIEPQGTSFRITDAMTMCARVLESGTSYATALYLNIQHFDRAVSAEERLGQLEAQQVAFERATQVRFRDMEEKIDALINQNKAKQAEINRLKATYEDPDGGSGSLTNTSGNE